MKHNVDLVNFISLNQAKIFTTSVRLFSPGFPMLDDNQHELHSNLQKTKENMIEYSALTELEYEKIKENFNPNLSQNMTDSDIANLESTLKATRDNMVAFKQECESGLKTKLSKIQETSLSGLEPLIDSVYSHRSQTGKVSDNVSQVLSIMNEIQL